MWGPIDPLGTKGWEIPWSRKGTVSKMMQNTFQSQLLPFLTEKRLFIDFIPWALSDVSLHGKTSLNFRISYGFFISINAINTNKTT